MALDGTDNPLELGCANMSPFQIDVNECNSVTGIAFSTPNDGDTIAIQIGDAIPLALNVSDPNNVLTNIQMSVSGSTFNGATGQWVPTAFGSYTLTATAQDVGSTLTDVIQVTLIDGVKELAHGLQLRFMPLQVNKLFITITCMKISGGRRMKHQDLTRFGNTSLLVERIQQLLILRLPLVIFPLQIMMPSIRQHFLL